MPVITCAHTADVTAAVLAQVHDLLVDVFGGFEDDDWEHALGGMHALAWDDDGTTLIGHASVVQRRLVHGGRALRCGYVEGVGVRADRQGQGVGAALMDPIERIVRSAYHLGALGSSEAGVRLYTGRGWQVWPGSTWALTPSGRVRTADEDGSVHVYPGLVPLSALDLSGELTCDWRDGDVW